MRKDIHIAKIRRNMIFIGYSFYKINLNFLNNLHNRRQDYGKYEFLSVKIRKLGRNVVILHRATHIGYHNNPQRGKEYRAMP